MVEGGRSEPVQSGGQERGRLKDYQILKELGRGGMGVVFKARQISLNREVALKMILAGEFAGETEVKRFHAEAEAAAHLDHPNIVSIYEIGEEDGRHFFSMQLVEGESLSRLIPVFQKDHRAAADIMVRIARAVHYAHQRGILHRDLKPGNILVDAQSQPHVTDFGLATRLQSENELTISGTILGTPGYMSPEQAMGQVKHLTTATDVYSLGSILYHMLAGHPPFTGDSAMKVLHRLLDEEAPPLRTIVSRIDRDLETICLKCLEKQPEARYSSAEALADDLERWLRFEPIQARRSTRWEQTAKWVRRKPVVAALLGIILAVGISGVSGVLWQWFRAEERLVRLNVVNGVRLAREGDLAGALLWYTEALRLDKAGPAQEDIHRIRIQSLLQQMPQLQRVWFNRQPVWFAQLSPREDRIAIIDGSDVLENRFRKAELSVWDFANGQQVSPIVRFAGGRPRMYRIRYQAFSPDGSKVVTINATDMPDKSVLSEVLILDVATATNTLSHPLTVDGLVSHVEFSPDGQFLVAASHSGIARVWDLKEGGRLLGDFKHKAWLMIASFSPDNRYLLTGGMDKMARLWDFRYGSNVFEFPHRRYLLDAQFSHNGKRIVTAASDGTGGEFHVWDVQTGQQVCALENGEGKVNGVLYQASFSPDDNQIIVANYDGTVTVWDANTGRLFMAPLHHDNGVLTARFAPNGKQLLSASFDYTARLWDARDGTRLAMLNHCGFLLDASFTHDGRQVITASTDGMVRDWKMPESANAMTLTHTGEVLHAEFSHNGRWVLTASADHTARVWDSQFGRESIPALVHQSAVLYATFSPDDQLIATASADGTARVWETATGKALASPLLHSNVVWHVAFDESGKQVVTASGKIRRANAASARTLRDFADPHTPQADREGEARVWDALSGKPLTGWLRQDDAIVWAEFGPDSRTVVTADARSTAQLWKVPEGLPTGTAMKHLGIVFRAVFSPNGKYLATATGGAGVLAKGAAELWDPRTGERVDRRFEHGDIVYDVEFSPDGRRLVTSSEDGRARVWDVKSGHPVTPPIENGNIVFATSFSPDGRFVLTSSEDGIARVWDAANGELIAQIRLHEKQVNSAVFSPDGKRILTASDDGRARIIELPRSDSRLEDLALLAQVLSARRIVKQGTALEPLDEEQFASDWTQLANRFPNLYHTSRPGKGR
jgi:WD40 repeat protein/tRNA A-37 threonylcarbamoyl transferase component Bud32